jgi:hypothetical protein
MHPKLSAPLVIALLVLAPLAIANPVTTRYVDGPGCDSHPLQFHHEELGPDGAYPGPFPAAEQILVSVTDGPPVCVGDDGFVNDWKVSITNLTGLAWENLFFVANEALVVGNADGTVEDLAAPGIFGDAFRIDALGVNPNLVLESLAPDGIFAPGETWEFLVTNFTDTTPGAKVKYPLPKIASLGVAGASPGKSNASIIAVQVSAPEPAMSLLLGLALAGMGLLTRPR